MHRLWSRILLSIMTTALLGLIGSDLFTLPQGSPTRSESKVETCKKNSPQLLAAVLTETCREDAESDEEDEKNRNTAVVSEIRPAWKILLNLSWKKERQAFIDQIRNDLPPSQAPPLS